MEVVSRILGHSSTAVTERHYAHLGDERLRAEVEAAFATASPAASRALSFDLAQLADLLQQLAVLAPLLPPQSAR